MLEREKNTNSREKKHVINHIELWQDASNEYKHLLFEMCELSSFTCI